MEDGLEQYNRTIFSLPQTVVLVFGSKGWIGQKVVRLLRQMNQTVSVVCAQSRADDKVAVSAEIAACSATHVMSFIGRTHGIYEGETIGTIDYLEKPGKLVDNIKDNLFAPLILAEICNSINVHYTYLGTGCIFEYDDEHPCSNETTGFKETDKPNFFGSSYSIVKGYTDQLMQTMFPKSVLNARIRMPITDEVCSRNFITKITSYDRVCSIPNSMTVLHDLLPVLIELALKNHTGTVNLVNPGLITHNEILNMYKEIVNPDFEWTNFSVEDQNKILASKRSNNCLDTTNVLVQVPHIKDAVRNVLTKMRASTL
jgi:3,5-epimerase/4-reductase